MTSKASPPTTVQSLSAKAPPTPQLAWIGFATLFRKEVARFLKVAFQTIAAPVMTAFLYLLIFGHVMRTEYVGALSYAQFLVPGIAMMSLLQNAFANGSSSLIQSKMTGNIVFVLLSPISIGQFYLAYALAASCRGLLVAGAIVVCTYPFVPVTMTEWPWLVIFAMLSSWIMGTLGIIAGLWAEKFDQLAAFQNFLITPMTMLAGVFYSTKALAPVWQIITHFNPFFYLTDGFRYGFIGHADVSPWYSLLVASGTATVLSLLTLYLLKKGYKIRG